MSADRRQSADVWNSERFKLIIILIIATNENPTTAFP